MNIVSRKKEIDILNNSLVSNKPEFIVVYGRRRVGKTYLIKEFFNDTFSFYSTGVFSKSKKDQLGSFQASLIQYGSTNRKRIKDWFEAFERLTDVLESKNVYRTQSGKKRVVFLDEMPWMDTPKSGFKVALERFWNTYGSRKNDLLLIVCGSATSWIIKHLINDRGGFYGRLTNKLFLSPFTLKECEEFIKSHNIKMSRMQLVDYYMVFGGIPFYFNLINPSLSVAQNIDTLIFSEDGTLHNEYSMLLSSLFTNYETHSKIVEELAEHYKGLSREDLLKSKSIKDSGSFVRALEELEQCGFIRSYPNYKQKKYGSIYQLVDPFTLFSIVNLKGKKIASWMNYLNTNGYHNWSGHAFETLSLNHIKSIKSSLGILGVKSNEYAFYSNEAQIDLLIDRDDKIINLCECKYYNQEYSINKEDVEEINNKVEVFNRLTKNKKDFIVTYITINGVKNNTYRDLAQSILTIDDLFLI